MKKTQLLILSALIVSSVLMAGCSAPAENTPETTATEETVENETTAFNVEKDPNELSMFDADFDFPSYITFDGYEDIKSEDYTYERLGDDSVTELLGSTLASNGYYEKNPDAKAVSDGDVVVISFESTIDEEEYSGGSQSGYAVLVGMNEFVPEVEAALVGKSVGDTFKISGTFPETYYNENVIGKTAEFSITVDEICKLLEFDDKIAAEISGDETMTKDKFLAELSDYYDAVTRVGLYNRIWEDVSAKANVEKLPVCDRLDYCLQIETIYRQYAESAGATFDDLLESWSMSYDEFYAEMYNSLSEEAVRQDLILCAICEKEGFGRTLSEEEYNKQASLIAVASGYKTVEQLEEAAGSKIQVEKLAFLNSVMEQLAVKLGVIE